MNKKIKNNELSILVCSYDKVLDILEFWDNYTYTYFQDLSKKYKIYYGLNFPNKENYRYNHRQTARSKNYPSEKNFI